MGCPVSQPIPYVGDDSFGSSHFDFQPLGNQCARSVGRCGTRILRGHYARHGGYDYYGFDFVETGYVVEFISGFTALCGAFFSGFLAI